MTFDEFSFVNFIREKIGRDFHPVPFGDDCASFSNIKSSQFIVSTDTSVEGQHFRLDYSSELRIATLKTGPSKTNEVHSGKAGSGKAQNSWLKISNSQVGNKAFLAALSDISAMGGRPLYALVSISGKSLETIAEISESIIDLANILHIAVIGGDVTKSDLLSITVTVIGVEPYDKAEFVCRNGAQVGDLIFVTGDLGLSRHGLNLLLGNSDAVNSDILAKNVLSNDEKCAVQRHFKPPVRVEYGIEASRSSATAMIDISDGLVIDLSRITEASNAGFNLDFIPVARGATLEEALYGGEDYELIFTICSNDVEEMFQNFNKKSLKTPIKVGEITSSEMSLNGQKLDQKGWLFH